MTPSIDQTLHKFANLWPNLTLLPILTLLPNFGGFHRTLKRVRLANRGRLLLRTPGPVPFGTCIKFCSNVSLSCHVYGPFEFRTSLGTSFLLMSCLYLQQFVLKRCWMHWWRFVGGGKIICSALMTLLYMYFPNLFYTITDFWWGLPVTRPRQIPCHPSP